MRTFAALSLLLLGLGLAWAATVPETLQEWSEFKTTYFKKYVSEEEEQARFAIYLDNKRIIAEHNVLHEAGEISWSVGMNAFGDLTENEFKAKYTGGYTPKTNDTETSCDTNLYGPPAPESWDWRNQGAVTPVKDQGFCGSCWSFGATGSAEGAFFASTGQSVSLSEQNLLDCARNFGCFLGGRPDIALDYMTTSGINSESAYPYESHKSECRQSSSSPTYFCSGCTYTEHYSEASLQKAVANEAPVAVAIDSGPLHFQFYRSGIIDDPSCSSTNLDHAVLAVGYGTSTQKYWIIKNSWGASWGQGGYFEMARDKGNMCGVATDAVFAKGPCWSS